MSKNYPISPPCRKKTYRKAQKNRGLVRYELQVNASSKAKFEKMVECAAAEYDYPWNIRQRMAKARSDIFDEITRGLQHEFTSLKQHIAELKDEIKALSPSFFSKEASLEQTPLPQAIASLPDDPKRLKLLLTRTYKECQQAKREARTYKQESVRFQELYRTVDTFNDELQAKLNLVGLEQDDLL